VLAHPVTRTYPGEKVEFGVLRVPRPSTTSTPLSSQVSTAWPALDRSIPLTIGKLTVQGLSITQQALGVTQRALSITQQALSASPSELFASPSKLSQRHPASSPRHPASS
jgi:hypothetical protein